MRVTGSKTTFSRSVPKRWVAAWISGSAAAESRITFA